MHCILSQQHLLLHQIHIIELFNYFATFKATVQALYKDEPTRDAVCLKARTQL